MIMYFTITSSRVRELLIHARRYLESGLRRRGNGLRDLPGCRATVPRSQWSARFAGLLPVILLGLGVCRVRGLGGFCHVVGDALQEPYQLLALLRGEAVEDSGQSNAQLLARRSQGDAQEPLVVSVTYPGHEALRLQALGHAGDGGDLDTHPASQLAGGQTVLAP